MAWGDVRSGQKSDSQVRWDEVSYDEVRWYKTRWDDAWWVKSGSLRWEGVRHFWSIRNENLSRLLVMESTITSRQCSHLLVADARPWSHYLQQINEFLKANHRRMSCYLFSESISFDQLCPNGEGLQLGSLILGDARTIEPSLCTSWKRLSLIFEYFWWASLAWGCP